MDHGVVHIDLPEAREPLSDFLVPQDTDAERRLTFDILVECDLGTGKQADRKVWLSDRRKTTGNRVVEFRRHQLVLDLGGPVRDVMQTIVTHRRHSSSGENRDFSPDPLFSLPWKTEACTIVTELPNQRGIVIGTLALALRARLCGFSVRSESNRWSIHPSQRAHTSMPVPHCVQGILELNNDAHGGENQGADAYYRRQNSF